MDNKPNRPNCSGVDTILRQKQTQIARGAATKFGAKLLELLREISFQPYFPVLGQNKSSPFPHSKQF
jgi:hypothetical protein